MTENRGSMRARHVERNGIITSEDWVDLEPACSFGSTKERDSQLADYHEYSIVRATRKMPTPARLMPIEIAALQHSGLIRFCARGRVKGKGAA